MFQFVISKWLGLKYNFNLFNNVKYFSTFPSNVYTSASNGVRCDTLWRKYAQQTVSTSPLLNPSDAVLLLYSFARIGFKDHRVVNALSLVILKNVHSLSPCGLSLVLNSLKKIDLKNRDLLEIVTNQVCLNLDKCSPQDISLVANAISHFHVYHLTFWNKLRQYLNKDVKLGQLEASLILLAYAKLDIRDVPTINILLEIIGPQFKNMEVKNSTLILHSLGKLDIKCKKIFNMAYFHIENLLIHKPDKFDLQALVIMIFTAVCFVKSSKKLILKLLEMIIPGRERLGNYKLGKLKMVAEAIKLIHKDVYEAMDQDLKDFLSYIQDTPLKMVNRSSRWANDVSKTLDFMKLAHIKNLHVQELYADIFFKDSNVAIKCAGSYSYYANSKRLTVLARLNIKLLELKGYNVIILPFYEWSELRSLEEKVERLYQLGREIYKQISINKIDEKPYIDHEKLIENDSNNQSETFTNEEYSANTILETITQENVEIFKRETKLSD